MCIKIRWDFIYDFNNGKTKGASSAKIKTEAIETLNTKALLKEGIERKLSFFWYYLVCWLN